MISWEFPWEFHGGLQKWVVPLVIVLFDRIFPYKPSSYGGTPIYGNPPYGIYERLAMIYMEYVYVMYDFFVLFIDQHLQHLLSMIS